jgi:hypothetical protein
MKQQMKNLASTGTRSVNEKSTIMMAKKFTKDFNQAVILISKEGQILHEKDQIHQHEIMNCSIKFENYVTIMFCLGFINNNNDDTNIIIVWNTLSNM